MDHHDDWPQFDPWRLARWAVDPTTRSRGCRDPLATPRSVIASHGGETSFWLAWLRGELDADLQAWFRQAAEGDADLRKDLHSIEQPHGSGYSTRAARAEMRNALEASSYLTAASENDASHLPGVLAFHDDEGQTETDLLRSSQGTDRKNAATREANQAELRRRTRSGLFALLAEVEIHVPAAEEAVAGTWLLEHLVGLPALSKFLQLQELQVRAVGSQLALRDRLVRALSPELFACEGERFRSRLSFRLFLRSRLQHACRRRSWLPRGPRYRDLPSAFAALSRERIGTLVRGILTARDVFQSAGVPCHRLAVLLETAP